MSTAILRDPEQRTKRSDADMDAEFDRHNVDVEEILNRTQRSFGSRSRMRSPIYEAPEFIRRLNAFEEVCVGDTVVFSCQWQAFPRPTIKWYKDDEEITEDARYQTEFADDCPSKISLVIKNASKKDEGAYKCKAENQEGVASTTGYLSVSGGSDNEVKTLASQSKQNRKAQTEHVHTVSSPPHLRTIVEQQSVEEREAASLRDQPPSPIQDFIDQIQTKRGRGVTWPMLNLGIEHGIAPRVEDESSSDSDTSIESQEYDRVRDDDVFDDVIPHHERHLLNGTQDEVSSRDISKIQNGTVVQNGDNNASQTPEITVTSRTKKSGRKTKNTEHRRTPVQLVSMPSIDIEFMLGVLDTPWLCFFPVVSSMTCFASATEMNPLFFILIMFLLSFVMFRLLFKQETT